MQMISFHNGLLKMANNYQFLQEMDNSTVKYHGISYIVYIFVFSWNWKFVFNGET